MISPQMDHQNSFSNPGILGFKSHDNDDGNDLLELRVLFTGGRDVDQAEAYVWLVHNFDRRMKEEVGPRFWLKHGCHGGARGFDKAADTYMAYNGIDAAIYEADWRRLGRSAGPKRNIEMFEDYDPDVVFAYKGGDGTAHMVDYAKKRREQGHRVRVVMAFPEPTFF